MTLVTPELGIIFWQTLIVLAAWGILSRFAWQPILAALKKRETETAHAVQQIAQAEVLMQQVNQSQEKLLEEAYLERDRIIDEALTMQKSMIAQARQEGLKAKQALLDQAQVAIASEEARALRNVRAKVGGLSIQIAEKLIYKTLRDEQAQLDLINQMISPEPSAVKSM